MRALVILGMVVVVALVLLVAGGPLLAMRNKAEADEPQPGSGQANQEPDAGQDAADPASGHRPEE